MPWPSRADESPRHSVRWWTSFRYASTSTPWSGRRIWPTQSFETLASSTPCVARSWACRSIIGRQLRRVFPPAEHHLPGIGQGRLGLVATGGSGALATIIGVVRAVEEAGGTISVYSLCSGGALFGFPLAAGLSSAEAAELVMGLEPSEYIDVSWCDMARAVPTLGRGWGGILRGDKLERYYRRRRDDAANYHLVVNTAFLGYEGAADTIVELVRRRALA